jgi:hypothetical protein
MKSFALATCFGFLAITSMSAQEGSSFAFNIGAGFTTPVGNTGRHLDGGWNLRAGAGFNFSPYVGALIDVGYDSFGINSATLGNIGVPGGGLHVFSATLDPIVHLNPHGHVDVYLTGGGGLYHRYQEFSQPSVVVAPGFDPFFGFYRVAVPVNQILASYSVNKPGVNAGAGIAIGTKRHGKIFAEAKYNRIFMGNNLHTDYVPVTFGFRW